MSRGILVSSEIVRSKMCSEARVVSPVNVSETHKQH